MPSCVHIARLLTPVRSLPAPALAPALTPALATDPLAPVVPPTARPSAPAALAAAQDALQLRLRLVVILQPAAVVQICAIRRGLCARRHFHLARVDRGARRMLCSLRAIEALRELAGIDEHVPRARFFPRVELAQQIVAARAQCLLRLEQRLRAR